MVKKEKGVISWKAVANFLNTTIENVMWNNEHLLGLWSRRTRWRLFQNYLYLLYHKCFRPDMSKVRPGGHMQPSDKHCLALKVPAELAMIAL